MDGVDPTLKTISFASCATEKVNGASASRRRVTHSPLASVLWRRWCDREGLEKDFGGLVGDARHFTLTLTISPLYCSVSAISQRE